MLSELLVTDGLPTSSISVSASPFPCLASQAFMKGAAPRLLHKIPANAFFFVAYEFFRTVLGVHR